jgi:predicted nuclease of predicted toxin-antitoxin system
LSLKLLIDEDSQAQPLVNLLRNAGHDVLTVNESGLMSQPDNIVLNYARGHNRILLTRNCKDFKALHEANSIHPGILAIYQEANPLKKMSRKDIARAIANLEAANIPIANQFLSLNHWNY